MFPFEPSEHQRKVADWIARAEAGLPLETQWQLEQVIGELVRRSYAERRAALDTAPYRGLN